MTAELDVLLAGQPIAPPTLAGAVGKKCGRHQWRLDEYQDDPQSRVLAARTICARCGVVRDETRARRGKQSRNYGTRAELAVARKYGGTKVGHAGGPVDVRGADFDTQVKTHRRLPPSEWTKAFAGMAQGNRFPRLLLRFVLTGGAPPIDYFVFPADAFLDWFGRDEKGEPE